MKKKKEDFKSRLERCCLCEADLIDDKLNVPRRSVTCLSASPKHPSHHRPRIMQTTDLDELKRWIGIDDRVVKGRCLVDHNQRRVMQKLSRLSDEIAEDGVTPGKRIFASRIKASANAGSKLETIRGHARSYLYGDSTLVADAKAPIEHFFEAFEIPMWVYNKVTVSSGSVLLFGSGSNVLTASELEIEEGGQVISYGSLTVNVTTLRKTMPSLVLAPMNADLVAMNIFQR